MKFLNQYMEEKNITIFQLSCMIGVTQATIKSWVVGGARPNDDNWKKLKAALDIKEDFYEIFKFYRQVDRLELFDPILSADAKLRDAYREFTYLRKKYRYTVASLAVAAGLGYGVVYNFETGRANNRPDVLLKLSERLFKTPAELSAIFLKVKSARKTLEQRKQERIEEDRVLLKEKHGWFDGSFHRSKKEKVTAPKSRKKVTVVFHGFE